ncbi:MAG: DUF4136 domain-containing protein [Opitutaceae bacterium]|nr:DUF4136 domain-containing protein [Opitutaceae bacterium]
MISFLKKSLRLSILPLVATLLFAGCSTGPTISNTGNPDVNISSLDTFALLPLPSSVPGGDPASIIRYGKTAQDSLRSNFTTKGYSEVALEDADFTVNIKATVIPKVNVTDWGYGYSHYGRHGSWGASNVSVDSYDEGTLIIEVFDNVSKQLAWVGSAKGRTKRKGMTLEELTILISNVLESFPTK